MQKKPSDLINELKQKRKKMLISRSRLSKRTGVSNDYISRIEAGEANPTLNVFVRIANELGYEVILQKIEKQDIGVNKTFVDDSLKVEEKTK